MSSLDDTLAKTLHGWLENSVWLEIVITTRDLAFEGEGVVTGVNAPGPLIFRVGTPELPSARLEFKLGVESLDALQVAPSTTKEGGVKICLQTGKISRDCTLTPKKPYSRVSKESIQ
jgi:hypothetical protein